MADGSTTTDLKTAKALLKEILARYPSGIGRDDLLKEYHDIAAEDLPYRRFGFSSLISFVDSVPGAGYRTVNGLWLYMLLPGERKVVPVSASRPATVIKKTLRPRLRPRRVWGNQKYASSLRRMGFRAGAMRRPLLPTPATGYDFSGSVQRPPRQLSHPAPAEYSFYDDRLPSRQPPVSATRGDDFTGIAERPALLPEPSPARYIFSWGGPLRDAGLDGVSVENRRNRYFFRYNSNSIIPMTERYLYDGDEMNPSGYDRLDYVDRPNMKRRRFSDDDDSYEQFCSEYATSRKRIRLDADHPVWCGPSTDPVFGYRQPRYMYTPRQHSDIATYKRLVREDATTAHTRLCRFFVTTMECDKGDMCWFLHVPGHQLTMPDRDRFKLPRRQCCYYLATGCPWEDRCTRLHVSNHDITPKDRQRLKLSQMASCRYHAANECIFGETCEWNHAAEEVKAEPATTHVTDHVTEHVVSASPEKKIVTQLMDQVALDNLEDMARIEHFATRV